MYENIPFDIENMSPVQQQKFDDLFWLNLHKEKDEVILHPFDLASTIAFPYLVSLNMALESAASVSASLPRSLASSARLSSADTL